MEKIKEIDIKFASFANGYEFRIEKFKKKREWNLCERLEDILWVKYDYDCTTHDLDIIGHVAFNVWARNIDPIGFRKILVDEINKLITENNKEVWRRLKKY